MKINTTAEIRKFLNKHQIDRIPKTEQIPALARAVAEIPWGRGRSIEEVLVTKQVGTCTGKHLVLQAALEELQIPYRTVVSTFRWGDQGIHFPTELHALLQQGEWDHGHNFVQVQNAAGEWVDLDITWDAALEGHGFAVLPAQWDGQTPFVGLRRLVARFDNVDLAEKKQALIAGLDASQKARREQFVEAFISWIEGVHAKSVTAYPTSALV